MSNLTKKCSLLLGLMVISALLMSAGCGQQTTATNSPLPQAVEKQKQKAISDPNISERDKGRALAQ